MYRDMYLHVPLSPKRIILRRLATTLIQLHRVELKEGVSEIIRVVGDPSVAIGASLRSALRVPVVSATGPASAEGDVDDLCTY